MILPFFEYARSRTSAHGNVGVGLRERRERVRFHVSGDDVDI